MHFPIHFGGCRTRVRRAEKRSHHDGRLEDARVRGMHDKDWAGQGIASGLLQHALIRCVAGARLIGGRALVVNALDEVAAKFWRRRGFLPSKDDPLILF